MKPSPDAGYSADTLARMKASDENLAGIVQGRRRAALALVSQNTRAAQQVYDDTAALMPEIPLPNQAQVPSWVPIGPGVAGNIVFVGEGPPTSENTVNAKPGDTYLDESSGDLYRLI